MRTHLFGMVRNAFILTLLLGWAAGGGARAAVPDGSPGQGGAVETGSLRRSGEVPLQGRVGELGDTRQMTFEGVKSFSSEELRRALRASAGFFVISHPYAPLAE